MLSDTFVFTIDQATACSTDTTHIHSILTIATLINSIFLPLVLSIGLNYVACAFAKPPKLYHTFLLLKLPH